MNKSTGRSFVAVAALGVIAVALWIYVRSGLYDIGADAHHWRVTYNILQAVRDRSIRERSKDLRPPNLNDPQPPNLSKVRLDPRDAFWVIKHGIKMSGMPAWSASHDDVTIWSMVAFLRRLPELTPQQYKEIVSKAPPDQDVNMD